jgi:flavin reductase (DIM6/NTAB) family NADH-FMN oxidoreductase RutF
MQFNLRELPHDQRYKLLIGIVVPRPIALVTSRNREGQLNAAPFSFFNLMGTEPAVVVLGAGNREPECPKDTVRNIHDTHEFVVNIVDEPMAPAMNICAVDFPYGESEVAAAGLTLAASEKVKVPGIAESPARLECMHLETREFGESRVLIGECVFLHVREGIVDPANFRILGKGVKAIGRLHGGGWYTRTEDQFEIRRISYQQWLVKQQEKTRG